MENAVTWGTFQPKFEKAKQKKNKKKKIKKKKKKKQKKKAKTTTKKTPRKISYIFYKIICTLIKFFISLWTHLGQMK